jgi:hypothetical protein
LYYRRSNFVIFSSFPKPNEKTGYNHATKHNRYASRIELRVIQ